MSGEKDDQQRINEMLQMVREGRLTEASKQAREIAPEKASEYHYRQEIRHKYDVNVTPTKPVAKGNEWLVILIMIIIIVVASFIAYQYNLCLICGVVLFIGFIVVVLIGKFSKG